jgi:predicted DNA-binding transcriptional regulator AlpA
MLTTDERLVVREREALAMLGIGRSLFLQLVYAGDIPSFKLGRARFYRVEALREWAARQEAEQSGAAA